MAALAQARCAAALGLLLVYAVLTVSVRAHWAALAFQAGVFALALVWVARLAWRGARPRSSLMLVPLAAPVALALVQLALGATACRADTTRAALAWGANLAVFWIALQCFASPGVRRGFLRALLYFGFGLSVVAVVQCVTAEGNIFWIFPSGYRDLVLGPFASQNNYAAFIELVLPLALWTAIEKRGSLVMAGAMYASAIATGSRAGSLLVTAEAIAVLAAAAGHGLLDRRALASALGKFAVFAAVFSSVAGWQLVWKRLQYPDPWVIRGDLLVSSLEMIRERPVAGFGLGAWPAAYPAYARFDSGLFANHAHNDWLEWAAEGGLPLLALLLWPAAWTTRRALRSPWALGIVFVFLHALVDYPMQKPALAALVFTLMGALAARGF